jgi:hypothetical protein
MIWFILQYFVFNDSFKRIKFLFVLLSYAFIDSIRQTKNDLILFYLSDGDHRFHSNETFFFVDKQDVGHVD